MASKRPKAPKILLHPMIRWIRGKIVYRLSHHGEAEKAEQAVSLRYGGL